MSLSNQTEELTYSQLCHSLNNTINGNHPLKQYHDALNVIDNYEPRSEISEGFIQMMNVFRSAMAEPNAIDLITSYYKDKVKHAFQTAYRRSIQEKLPVVMVIELGFKKYWTIIGQFIEFLKHYQSLNKKNFYQIQRNKLFTTDNSLSKLIPSNFNDFFIKYFQQHCNPDHHYPSSTSIDFKNIMPKSFENYLIKH